jgi:tRNA (guanosine-2'-O-)-methyltransferase
MDYPKLFEALNEMMPQGKIDAFQKVMQYRTQYATVVLENIYQPHNASAVMRSCDCFGIQDLYVIENDFEYTINPKVAMGATKWLNLHRFNKKENNTSDCLNALKQKGYRLVATSPHQTAQTLHDFDVTKGRFALLFGSEKPGLSNEAMKMADEFLYIPMYGFTESFNISVSAALCLQELSDKIRKEIPDFQLSEEVRNKTLLKWYKRSFHHGDKVIEETINRLKI